MTLNKTTTLAAMAMALLWNSGAALAQQRGEMSQPSFAELDADGDGQITRSDLTAFAAARFAAADTDNSGTLSAAELQARSMARAAERSAALATRMLNRLDADGDGALSPEELRDQAGAHRGQGGKGIGARMLARADTDGDGAVSEAEYTAALETRGERGARRANRGHGEGESPRRHN